MRGDALPHPRLDLALELAVLLRLLEQVLVVQLHVRQRQLGRLRFHPDADHAGVLDEGMLDEETFQLGGRDLEAFVLDL